MTTDLAIQEVESLQLARREQEEAGYAALAHVLGSGDLAQLTNAERVGHYVRLCRSLGLNELSRPFDWIYFKERESEAEKLTLYPNQSCAAQLRRQHHMRVMITRREIVGELFVCEAKGFTPDGREDVSTKYVPLTNKYGRLKGTFLANAMMKAETGAKRRVTLSMVGLASPPDSDEAASWREAVVDGVGRIIDSPTAEQKALAADPKMARAIGETVFEDMPIGEDGTPSQAALPEELEQPKRQGPPPTFHADKAKWSHHWAMVVKGTYLDDDDARHRYVEAYTSSWPAGARTNSLSRFLEIITDVQAADFIERTRHHLEERAAAEAADPDGELDGIDGVTPEQAHIIDAEQRGQDARPMADLSDEEIERRFEQGTERLMGRPRADVQGPTRTELLAEVRRLVDEAREAGATIDGPDHLAELDEATLTGLVADIRTAIQAAKVAF